MKDTFYITTAIDYTNAAPHIGHAYEKILADTIARAMRCDGRGVVFLTGVDQHGQKVQQSAAKENLEPMEFARGVTSKFLLLWEKLGISNDAWAETTNPLHVQCVQEALTRLHNEGQIYKARHGGYYSVRQEQFLTDKDRNEDGEFGADWGEVIFLEEENYYFRLAAHKDWLLGLLSGREDIVMPKFRQNELRNAVEKISGDLCISRPKERLSWGIELPFDSGFVTYVWFDALMNYLSFAGYPGGAEFGRLWPCDRHVIGKDILVPAHGIYWTIMLHALGFSDADIPGFLVHGYVNLGGDKVSKSTGNTVDPMELADRYGAEALRYYLMGEAAIGQDLEFAEERLVGCFNTGLANGLGNLLNRTLNMAGRYLNGSLTSCGDSPLRAAAESASTTAVHAYRALDPAGALEAAGRLVDRCNAYVEEMAPWKMAKDPERSGDLNAVLFSLAECLRILAILHAPVLPDAAVRIFDQLGLSTEPAFADLGWAAVPHGYQLGAARPVFPRIEPQS
jgi:methionyl-tRNA synthetase